MAIALAISEWSGWQAAVEDNHSELPEALTVSEAPDVAVIPPMLRRRLNLLGRACASQVLRLMPKEGNLPIVYCSQHGDIERTLKILDELVAGEPVSPMHFSLAVHNAICGVLSIQIGLNANISTIAAGQQGLVPVLLEAAGILQGGAERVLCVLCDVPLPEIYQSPDSLPPMPYSVCFVVARSEGIRLSLEQTDRDCDRSRADQLPTCLMDFLASDSTELALDHNGLVWTLARIND